MKLHEPIMISFSTRFLFFETRWRHYYLTLELLFISITLRIVYLISLKNSLSHNKFVMIRANSRVQFILKRRRRRRRRLRRHRAENSRERDFQVGSFFARNGNTRTVTPRFFIVENQWQRWKSCYSHMKINPSPISGEINAHRVLEEAR